MSYPGVDDKAVSNIPNASGGRGRRLRIVYVARNDGTDMRVSKECNSLLKFGHDVHFVGWRDSVDHDRPDPMPDVPKHFFSSLQGGSALKKLLRAPGFAFHVGRMVHGLRPDVVHFVNEDLGLLVVSLQRGYGFKSVCDLFDSIELKWGQKRYPVNVIARLVTKLVHEKSDVLIVTDDARKARLGTFQKKAHTVSNYPVDVGEEFALRLPDREGPLRLYVAGTLYAARGLSSLLELLNARDDVEIISAGWLHDEIAREFIGHPAVDYRGVIKPSESLQVAASCHAIVALYDPSNENNVMASPNKIYDAICIGRPVIINREAAVSHWVSEHDAGYVVRYGDMEELGAVVDALNQQRDNMYETAVSLRELFERGYSWDVAERTLLTAYAQYT